MSKSDTVKPCHLQRMAVIYVRQSTTHQVISNQESLELQYSLKQRALELGWREDDIQVIDSDLGITGSSVNQRKGFKQLLADVALEKVGIILSYEVTRLSRNCSDWYPLLDICSYKQCLIGDRDGIYDPSTINGRMLLGLKGQLSEIELHTLRGRLNAGLLNKAKRGELALQLPIGLIRTKNGEVQKDPDSSVQQLINIIFDIFLRVGSAAKTVQQLNKKGLNIPRRDNFGDLYWRKPSIAAVISTLKNPAYAGVFVYGRTRSAASRKDPSIMVREKVPLDESKVVLHDIYPAYIEWETYEKVQSMLKDNYAEYDRNKTRGIPRPGKALLHGIVYCGECGHKMVVQYKPNTRYICNFLRQQHQTPICQNIPADPVDETVVSAFFEALSPAEIDLYEKMVETEKNEKENLRKMQDMQLQRLRYQAQLSERQYNQVDPDNRLVANELEKRWENSLQELKRAELAFNAENNNKAVSCLMTKKIRNAIKDVSHSLPSIWKSGIAQDNRKKFLRCLIDKVVVHRDARDNLHTRIVWKGGLSSEFNITVNVGSLNHLSTSGELVNNIISLAKKDIGDAEIAKILSEKGFKSPMSSVVLESTVRNIRLKNRILKTQHQSHPLQVKGYL